MAGMLGAVTVRIRRSGPTDGFAEFRVERRESQTVLDVVTEIQREQDATLSYRFACRVGMCGSCGMMVNGRPRWTCRTRVAVALDGDDLLTLEPLRNLPVVKDLAVDMTVFFDKWRDAKGYFEPGPAPPETADLSQRSEVINKKLPSPLAGEGPRVGGAYELGGRSTPPIPDPSPASWRSHASGVRGEGRSEEARVHTTVGNTTAANQPRLPEFAKISPQSPERRLADAAIECINCGLCYAACDVVEWNPDYLGPAALNRAWTLTNDARDQGQDARIAAVATDAGCHACHSHMSCTSFCPKGLSPTFSIAGLKRESLKRTWRGPGRRRG